MNYIQELRKLVGNQPLILVGCSLLLFDREGRILLLRRQDNGGWGPPGGALELGETVEQAARREAFEEAGLVVGALRLFGVFSGPELFYEYPSGDQVYIVDVVFSALCPEAAPVVDPREHSEARFFPVSEIPEKISPPVKPIIKRVQEIFANGGVTGILDTAGSNS